MQIARNLYLLCLLLLLLLIVGCNSKGNSEILSVEDSALIVTPEKVKVEDQKNEIIISYEQFSDLSGKLAKDIRIPGFKLRNTPIYPSIMLVDKDITFDKKQSITVDGTLDDLRSTEQLLIYENDNQTMQIQIKIAYTSVVIGNELVSWNLSSGYESTSKELSNNIDLATLTYKNIIITILQNAKDRTELEITKGAIRSVIKSLKNLH
ncbi:hypothetical protein [Paenibacillus sp. IHBB 10380]|uniref:hypothetical protein n=1 Tax=Paenibacillus sp. IHBB 10380 TaxID=1566358 RepID=UPI0005CFC277|nr:hypothetical protein [Paenibacillus sp. IHBB 10380]AJS58048.1 hypothetical protein UB51_05535 [Paenibacillus sp. IHBB 10380]